jgi:hypothetical protein
MKKLALRTIVLTSLCGFYAMAISNQKGCSYELSVGGIYTYSCSVTCTNSNASCSWWGGCHC